jgi:hypothetical protein
LEEFEKLVTSDCSYCGAAPFRESTSESRGKILNSMLLNGIDRCVNRIGYLGTNAVSSCWPCNQMKGTMDGPEFLDLVRRIAIKHPDAVCHGDVLVEIANAN